MRRVILLQRADARGCVQPGAQGFVADGVVERRVFHREGASGMSAVADAGEDRGGAEVCGAPESSLVIGEYAVVVGRTVHGAAFRQPRHAILLPDILSMAAGGGCVKGLGDRATSANGRLGGGAAGRSEE